MAMSVSLQINAQQQKNLKVLKRNENTTMQKIFTQLAEMLLEGKILISSSGTVFFKENNSNEIELEEINLENEFSISNLQSPIFENQLEKNNISDKELTILENLETSILEIKTQIENLEIKLEKQSTGSNRNLRNELIKSLLD